MIDGEQVERVALAIEAARGTPTDMPSPVAWRMAIAAIQAMPEPPDPRIVKQYQKDWEAKLDEAKANG